MPEIKLDVPYAQIGFASALKEIRPAFLQDALASVVSSMQLQEIDEELHRYSDAASLRTLAAHGMRGELLFALPCILERNPRLLGYYRLLLGYSQKSFYASNTGAGMFKTMEERGTLSSKQQASLPDLCQELNTQAKYMIAHFDSQLIAPSFFDQLTLLTLGPQLRGGANVQRGTSAISQVFRIVYEIVRDAVVQSDHRCIVLKNKAGRTVHIQFAPDPDIVIREELTADLFRNLVAVEVKGGQDYSNIHNRMGEAEKSHQKAKKNGFIECWTVFNVDKIDRDMARKESPTTNRFYKLSDLINHESAEYKDFSMQVLSIVSI